MITFSGAGSIQKLPLIIQRGNFKRIFLVTGRSSYETSPAKKVLDRLSGSIEFLRFYDFSVNPKIEDVKKGIEAFRSRTFDAVIAVGGGTVIDMAKLINILGSHPNDPESFITGDERLSFSGVPLISAPTTSGTGSEATHFAVVYIDGKKYSLAHSAMVSRTVILDPELTTTMSSYQTACSGLDALSQAVESCWSVNSTGLSRYRGMKAAKLILKYLPAAVNAPNIHARDMMLKGAHIAGKALNRSKSTAPHAYSYFLTSRYGIPHGHAVGMLLGPIFELNCSVSASNTNDPRGIGFVKRNMRNILRLFPVSSAGEITSWLGRFISSLGLEPDVKKAGLDNRADQNDFLSAVNSERLKNNPRQLSSEDVAAALGF